MTSCLQRLITAALCWVWCISATSATTLPPWQLPFDRTDWYQQWLPGQLLDPLAPYVESSCSNPIQIWIPPHEAHDNFYAALLDDWQSHPLSEFTPCLQVKRYPTAELDCAIEGVRQRQRCTLPLLPSEAGSQHIVFRGSFIASVDPRVLMLPERADVMLMAHEIGHWLGLVDEYAMSPSIARNFCTGRYRGDSLNVVVTEREVLSALELQTLWAELPWRDAVSSWEQLGVVQSDGRWRLGTRNSQQVGLHSINTCAHAEGYAWRPVGYFTAMQYHDTNRWPELYLELIRRAQQ